MRVKIFAAIMWVLQKFGVKFMGES